MSKLIKETLYRPVAKYELHGGKTSSLVGYSALYMTFLNNTISKQVITEHDGTIKQDVCKNCHIKTIRF